MNQSEKQELAYNKVKTTNEEKNFGGTQNHLNNDSAGDIFTINELTGRTVTNKNGEEVFVTSYVVEIFEEIPGGPGKKAGFESKGTRKFSTQQVERWELNGQMMGEIIKNKMAELDSEGFAKWLEDGNLSGTLVSASEPQLVWDMLVDEAKETIIKKNNGTTPSWAKNLKGQDVVFK